MYVFKTGVLGNYKRLDFSLFEQMTREVFDILLPRMDPSH
jgi:hypothetical protein